LQLKDVPLRFPQVREPSQALPIDLQTVYQEHLIVWVDGLMRTEGSVAQDMFFHIHSRIADQTHSVSRVQSYLMRFVTLSSQEAKDIRRIEILLSLIVQALLLVDSKSAMLPCFG
jgi:hypothetical protein